MLGALKDLAAISALTFEYAAGVVQSVGQDVDVGLVPGHELSIIPNDPLKAVIGLRSHDFLLRRARRIYRRDGPFSAPIPYFASPCNTRYEWPADRLPDTGFRVGALQHDPFV